MEGSEDVGFDERRRPVDRAIDMRFGRQVDDGVRPVLVEQTGHLGRVADVPLHEDVQRVVERRGKRVEISGVGQFVEIDDAQPRGDHLPDEATPDEAGAAGD